MRSIIHTVQTGAPVETLYLSEPTTVEKRRCPSDVGIVFIPRLITKKTSSVEERLGVSVFCISNDSVIDGNWIYQSVNIFYTRVCTISVF